MKIVKLFNKIVDINMISFDDFAKIQMQVGTILEALDFEKAKKKAYKLKIDFGESGIKHSSAQITDLYTKEGLVGKQVIAVTNFPPKQIANFMSECLVLGLYSESGVVLLGTERKVKNGLRVF